MNKITKIILWIVGVVVALVLMVLGFGFVLYFLGSGVVDESTEFAKSSDKNGCLEETASRVSDCDGPVCLVSSISFGFGCMEEAAGDRDQFCVGKQPVSKLPKNYCEPYQNSKYCAQAITGTVGEFCKL